MEITPVTTMLASGGLKPPSLNVLVPNVDNYKALLLQPRGDIDASSLGVWNRERDHAYKQYGDYLVEACDVGADLVVTPEYSMPWNALKDAIKSDVVPSQGKLWALGCESIKYSELEALRDELSDFANIIFEPLEADDERFLSPLAYIFNTTIDDDNAEKIIVLVQFKTHPMGDPDHFEVNGMQRGTCIYQFGGQDEIKLSTLICSDVFAFEDSDARTIHDRGLILHIQLNQSPRHQRFISSRHKLLGFNGDTTEIISLNWASDICLTNAGAEHHWENIACSAWYLKSLEFDNRDATLEQNHHRGLYYTWYPSLRTHALFLNFKPATFLFEATKVAHIGVAGPVARRRGPKLIKRCLWDDTDATWCEQVAAESGFFEIIDECGDAANDIKHISKDNPFAAERVLALCAGEISGVENWFNVDSLDACVLDASEIIRRLTFCQDTDTSAQQFRIARLKRLKHLWLILHTDDKLPASLNIFKNNFHLKWSQDFPHQNIETDEGECATIIYMGEDTGINQIDKVKKNIAESLRRFFADDDDRRTALQRLVVWYRDDNGDVVPFEPHKYVQIDQAKGLSEFDVGRE